MKLRSPTAKSLPAVRRVAIYTRKSTDEGLDQSFNSLDAQRQAVEAYVASQQSEGWVALPERYDDGGFSGATTERPAFQQLLRDIEGGLVDIVAVYKIDRLSRSLLDFARIMELLDAKGVSFVSTTQSFNTGTSVGRMTLNLLATFAQFEREQIAERTRDKMRAARRRGLYTGGRAVFGYDVVEKKLVPNLKEASIVRKLFSLLLELSSVAAVVAAANARGLKTKLGNAWQKQSLRYLLTNPLYIGKVDCQGELFQGEQEPLISQEVWEKVQSRLTNSERPPEEQRRRQWTSLLEGMLFCGCGSPMSHHYTSKGSRKHGYYVCRRYQREGARACPLGRVSTGMLDTAVIARVRAVGQEPGAAVIQREIARYDSIWDELFPAEQARILRLLVERVVFSPPDDVSITFKQPEDFEADDNRRQE